MEDKNLTKIPKGIMLGCGASIILFLFVCIGLNLVREVVGLESYPFVIGDVRGDEIEIAAFWIPVCLAGIGGFAVWFLVYNWYMRQRRR